MGIMLLEDSLSHILRLMSLSELIRCVDEGPLCGW